MSRGRLEQRTRAAVRVLTGDHGLGAQVYFVDGQTGEATPALLGRVVHRCGSCETVLVRGERGEDAMDCFECGTRIGADVDACPSCGWTW
ncbi:hypothetical protein [Enhygromyxa salina]|nr:hypothetical protein [Enhygromyxa salina]